MDIKEINREDSLHYLERRETSLEKSTQPFLYLSAFGFSSESFRNETSFTFCAFPLWIAGSSICGVLVHNSLLNNS